MPLNKNKTMLDREDKIIGIYEWLVWRNYTDLKKDILAINMYAYATVL